ncbi:hypothetical protein [Kitasatospora sp. DSM 101779]|uniref:hypothetical protein n=1 Tax=Kitasatospora sp. DSM 101779 TaxID=2853165 RepID=UPI0021DA01ED|nr:hypothetical protein [Kitasatospora sp. DSM 101779]MCU7825977.1 hypothetical protein [Kitasatospora sp. DSM 101779]
MVEQNIEVSFDGLNKFADTLDTFERDVKAEKFKIGECPVLLPGNDTFVPIANLREQVKQYRGSLVDALETIRGSVDKIIVDLQNAKAKLWDGEGDSLTEAQMLDILQDVLGGGTTPTSTPPKVT